jgi:hypothetical protein
MPDLFCTDENKIAHSTLYKAVHGLAQNLSTHGEEIRKEIQQKYCKTLPEVKETEQKMCTKSVKEHTRLRESALHKFLSHFLWQPDPFIRSFYANLKPFHLILSLHDPPIVKLYK